MNLLLKAKFDVCLFAFKWKNLAQVPNWEFVANLAIFDICLFDFKWMNLKNLCVEALSLEFFLIDYTKLVIITIFDIHGGATR